INEDKWEAYNLDKKGKITLTQTYNYRNNIDDSMLISSPHMNPPTGPFKFIKNSWSKQEKLKYDLDEYDEIYYYNRYKNWLIIRNKDKYVLTFNYDIPREPFEFVYDS